MHTTIHLTDDEIKRFCISRRSLGERQQEILAHMTECEICNRKYWEMFQVKRIPLEIELYEGCTLVIDRDESGHGTMHIDESEIEYQQGKETR